MENDQTENESEKSRGGYYTVNIIVGNALYPYIVFAHSDLDAARRVKAETGYFAEEKDVEGPYQRQ